MRRKCYRGEEGTLEDRSDRCRFEKPMKRDWMCERQRLIFRAFGGGRGIVSGPILGSLSGVTKEKIIDSERRMMMVRT